MTELIIGIDDRLTAFTNQPSLNVRTHFRELVTKACADFAGLPVQLKLNAGARILGHEVFDMIEEAGMTVFLDYKLGQEVLDTMWADMRALSGFSCIKRLTFRADCPVEFLTGTETDAGATTILPHTSFLPVGPVTDLLPSWYARYGYTDRATAVQAFGADIQHFGDSVTEFICSAADIPHFSKDFLLKYRPITPAVRPVGLDGNAKNNRNALTVEEAVAQGASAIVVGSPIMQSDDQRAAAELVLEQLAVVIA